MVVLGSNGEVLGGPLVDADDSVRCLLLGLEGGNKVGAEVREGTVVVYNRGLGLVRVEAGAVANLTSYYEVLVAVRRSTVNGGAVHIAHINASINGSVVSSVVYAELTSGGLVSTLLSLYGELDALDSVLERSLSLEAALSGHAELADVNALKGAEASSQLTANTLACLEGSLGGERNSVRGARFDFDLLCVEQKVIVEQIVGRLGGVFELYGHDGS
mmetsp:Transcript_19016/g.33845  ORF Transcript_19016/g.33845 Transcript_19016/m.33845 type:complete len:217 (+) Transcript_19016:437-1087(+)